MSSAQAIRRGKDDFGMRSADCGLKKQEDSAIGFARWLCLIKCGLALRDDSKIFAAPVCKMLEVENFQELVTFKSGFSTGFSTASVEK